MFLRTAGEARFAIDRTLWRWSGARNSSEFASSFGCIPVSLLMAQVAQRKSKEIIMRIFLAGVASALSLFSSAMASPPPAAAAVFDGFVQASGAPGVSLTVIEDGKVIWDQAVGMADLEQATPMTTETPTRIGSISKTMTAVAAVRLASEGVIDLDKPASAYLADFKGPAGKVTLRQLASHTGCVRGYRDGEGIVYKHYETPREALELFENDKLECKPGAQFIYSSFGFNLLSAILASATGESFHEVMNEKVWAPLGLSESDFDDVVRVIPRRARFYEAGEGGAPVNAPFTDNSYKYAGGGMLSSTRDLASYGAALIGDGFLTDVEKDMLFTAKTLSDGSPTAYGLGWYVDFNKFIADRRDKIPPELYDHLMQEIEGRRIIWHSGTAEGAIAILMMEPSERRVLALALNKGDLEKEAIVTALTLMTALKDTPH